MFHSQDMIKVSQGVLVSSLTVDTPSVLCGLRPNVCLAVFPPDHQPQTDPGGVQPVPGGAEVRDSPHPPT